MGHNPDESTKAESTKADACKSCWLCKYQGNRSANEVIRLIMDGVSHMSMDSLVAHCKYLLDNVETGSNVSKKEIRKHITEHMLHPRVKLAVQLHSLTSMQKEVAKCCLVQDVESGERCVNPHAMRAYLSLCSQVSSVYKMGEDKLLFTHSTQTGNT
jgi:hypothetical protein